MKLLSKILLIALLGVSKISYGAAITASIGNVVFQIGMDEERALLMARQSFAVIPVSGTEKFFLYAKDKTGKLVGAPLGGIGLSKGLLTQIRRDLGSLDSPETLVLGRRIATSITESGYKEQSDSLISQSYREYSTAQTITIEVKLPDRVLRVRVYESRDQGTRSSVDVTEYFGESLFD